MPVRVMKDKPHSGTLQGGHAVYDVSLYHNVSCVLLLDRGRLPVIKWQRTCDGYLERSDPDVARQPHYAGEPGLIARHSQAATRIEPRSDAS